MPVVVGMRYMSDSPPGMDHGTVQSEDWAGHPCVVRLVDRLVNNGVGLMKYQGRLVIYNSWAVHNNRCLVINYRGAVNHNGRSVNDDIRAMKDLGWRMIDNRWSFYNHCVFLSPLHCSTLLLLQLCFLKSFIVVFCVLFIRFVNLVSGAAFSSANFLALGT